MNTHKKIIQRLNQITPWKFYSALCALFLFFYLVLPPFAQYESYHDFAGDLPLLGIPNFLNVASNLFFCLAGIIGFYRLHSSKKATKLNMSPIVSVWRWKFFFVTIFFVGIGSSYYHLHPNTLTLFWDRLPMSLGFAALTANFLKERFSLYQKTDIFWIIQIFSLYSVIYWILSEMMGMGDLKLYAIVQFATLLLISTILIKSPRGKMDRPYWILFVGYGLAKLFEMGDLIIFEWGDSLISGHVLKHLVAGIALCFFIPPQRHSRDS